MFCGTELNLNQEQSLPRPRATICVAFPHWLCGAEQNLNEEQSLNQSTVDIDSGAKIKPLIVHGLQILRELAEDPENCTEIYNTTDLVSKIIAPVRNGLHIAIQNDEATAEIVRESLRVVAKLTSGTGECSTRLCSELVQTYGRTAENIVWILRNSSDQEMRMRAAEILSRLTLGRPRMLEFVGELQSLLFDPQDSPLTLRATGKALTALVRSRGDEFPDGSLDIQKLVAIISDEAYCKEYRAVTGEILAQICAKSKSTDEDRDRLSSVANALSTVLEAIVTETTNSTKPDKRRFLASFLGLAVQIREKLATAEDFANALTGLPVGSNNFAEKMKEIIETTDDGEDEVCLAILKDATKLVTWMIGTKGSPRYIHYFREAKIAGKLDAAVKAMAHLERYMVMTGGADEMECYVTLQELVAIARDILVPNVWALLERESRGPAPR